MKNKELWADFFIGIDKDTWLDLNKNPYGGSLPNKDDMIIGFVHTHLDASFDHFGPDDCRAIKELSLGRISWTNIPWYTNNNNPEIIDRMYFEVSYPGGSDILSWHKTTLPNLRNFYNDIIQTGKYIHNYDYYKVSDFYKLTKKK